MKFSIFFVGCVTLVVLVAAFVGSMDREKFVGEYRLPRLTLAELDAIPYVDENNAIIDNIKYERQEQLHADMFIPSNAVVLELGARYGTVSCVINNKLDKPFGHVVIEPDNTVLNALDKNRASHNAYFTVYNAIISESARTFVPAGYGSSVTDASDVWAPKLPSVSLQHLMDTHGFRFDTLVADCEGCLDVFVAENPEFVASLNLIMFEKDQNPASVATNDPYAYVESMLVSMGFEAVETGFQSVWRKPLLEPAEGASSSHT